MKRMVLTLLVCCLFAAVPALAEITAEPAQQSEWTVLFYFCGSDLESSHGFASENISAICECCYPKTVVKNLVKLISPETEVPETTITENVNVVIQTGGSEKWKNEITGLKISTKALQRWSYIVTENLVEPHFHLEQELPLQSMADPETLADFIRWGTQAYPARKYALVLWGHGDGAKTGIFCDELFNNDVLHLDELRQALKDGGAFFETILLDACMMANLETACSVQDHAAWMVASEELVPGRGTAIQSWLQELYNYPKQDGKQLGRNIGDMTQIAYANTSDAQSNSILTWSVIDLSKIKRVDDLAYRFFQHINEVYVNDPTTMSLFASFMYEAEEYGDAQQDMRDIASIFFRTGATMLFGDNLRDEMIDALTDAVVYSIRGSGRSEARGLSFCYATDFTEEELKIYAQNCMSPYYLAFLDAITPWTAPDWVYDTAKRLPEINTLDQYRLSVEKCMTPQGVPGVSSQNSYPAGGVNYCLYQVDEKTKQKKRLGTTVCRSFLKDDQLMVWSAVEPWLWPSIDGEFCSIELIGSIRSGTNTQSASYSPYSIPMYSLYSIPIQIGPDTWNLRYGREYQQLLPDMLENTGTPHTSHYTVYGLWEGYDDDTEMLSRNVKSLSQMAGQEYHLLYPIEKTKRNEKEDYIIGKKQTLYRALNIEAKTLPAGTYYLQYEVMDMFMRPIVMEPIEMYWDGKALSFPTGFTWEGTARLQWGAGNP